MGNIFDYGDVEEVNIRGLSIPDSYLTLEALKKVKRLTLEGRTDVIDFSPLQDIEEITIIYDRQ